MSIFFLHGVPDTPHMWNPLIEALGLQSDAYTAPALPGFGVPFPGGFVPAKEAYLNWLIDALEKVYAASGPIDLVAHDWGALLSARAAHLRGDLLRSWTLIDALPEPSYRWHDTARLWQTPIVGELVMAVTTRRLLRKSFIDAGLPAAFAEHEVAAWNGDMRRAILALYRSAKTVAKDWGEDLSNLPNRGLVVWGENDPFVGVTTAESFCKRWNVPLHIEKGAGHWVPVERPGAVADRLKQHWETP